MACASQQVCSAVLQVGERQPYHLSFMPDLPWQLFPSCCDTQGMGTTECLRRT